LKAKKVVLAGDHCQLSPTVKTDNSLKDGLNITLLEKCIALHPESVTLLEEQYRMHEAIMGYSSKVFYQDKLKAHSSVAKHSIKNDNAPLLFVDTAGCGFEEKLEGTSSTNPEEAALTLKHLANFCEEISPNYTPENFPTIAVISPYSKQVTILQEQILLIESLKKYAHRISVNTIDSFQGQERDIVYISMTRSNDDGSIGFLSDIRRMNVAMTRARKKLVVIGDSATLAQFPFYANFIEYAEKIGGYLSAWEVI
jgi:ATP-dependent RNA/DNA helicase IGHMBP2